MFIVSRLSPARWWDTAGTTVGDWWTTASDWLDRQGDRAGRIALTIVVATLLWVLGRLAIRAFTRGLRKGMSPGVRGATLLRRRTGRPGPEPSLEAQLEANRNAQRAQTVGVVLRSALTLVIVVLTVLTVLREYDVDITSLLAGGAIVGVALGFGAQSLVKDLLSGMFMLLEDQYGVGDIVDVGEASGVVEAFGLRATRLRSLDGTVWFIPNGEIRRVGNMSRLWSRAMIEIRVDFDEDVDAAREAILDAAREAIARPDIAPHVLGEATVPGIEELESDAVVLRLMVQVQPAKQWDVQRAIRAEIQKKFRNRGLTLAVPVNRVYTRQRPASDAAAAGPAAPAGATAPGGDKAAPTGGTARPTRAKVAKKAPPRAPKA
jgi:small-conductance mechanosensitive channel